MSLKKAAVVTAVSHYIARLAQEDLRMVLPIKVIYNGVDTKMFSPARYSMTHQNEVKVFFSGNLKVRKGSHWLPGIANKLNKNIRIFYTQGLRAQNILPLSPNIESIGSVSFEQMPDRYRQMDILLMPTVREGFGLSVAEAMACGLPVVVSDCSSLPELIDHGKGGYLCPVGNVDMFAEKINFLAENPDLRKQMGEYNRAKVEMMFSLDQMIENYKKLFEETLDTWKK
jgi:glycosyltransferase involved in cell wall biosynthesis